MLYVSFEHLGTYSKLFIYLIPSRSAKDTDHIFRNVDRLLKVRNILVFIMKCIQVLVTGSFLIQR